MSVPALPVAPTGPAYVYRVAGVHRVIDGDTYELLVDLGFRVFSRLMIRLHEYSCPELAAPGGLAAKIAAEQFLRSTPLLMASYKDQQTFARWVADIWLITSPGVVVSLGELLVEGGYAVRGV